MYDRLRRRGGAGEGASPGGSGETGAAGESESRTGSGAAVSVEARGGGGVLWVVDMRHTVVSQQLMRNDDCASGRADGDGVASLGGCARPSTSRTPRRSGPSRTPCGS